MAKNIVRLLSLKNRYAFDYHIKKSKKYVSRHFVIYFSQIDKESEDFTSRTVLSSDSFVLYGFKISRKYGKASKRNLLRRRLKNIYLNYLQNNYQPLSIIFIPRFGLDKLSFNEIESEINKAINWFIRKDKSINCLD